MSTKFHFAACLMLASATVFTCNASHAQSAASSEPATTQAQRDYLWALGYGFYA